jgi:natural resistance-associated macrophage protein 2
MSEEERILREEEGEGVDRIDEGVLSSDYLTFKHNNRQTNLNDENDLSKFSFKKLWKYTGPGFLMSIAFIDPGNLESDIQSGVQSGYKLIWVLFYSTLIGFILQMLTVRLGLSTGLNLAQICKREYSKYSRIFLWLMIEIALITSDIQQVIGSALAINILTQGYISIEFGILITLIDTFLFLFIELKGLRVLESLFGILILIMLTTFLYMFVRIRPDLNKIFVNTFIPWCTNCTYLDIKQISATLGSIIMPHNLYFHSTLVLTRNINHNNELSVKEANKYYFIESSIALLLSFISNLFVVSICAKTFFNKQIIINNINLFNISDYIKNDYGLLTLIIWSIGLLAAGQSSTMTGTYTGQFIIQGFTGLQINKFKRICLTRSLALIPAILIAILAKDYLYLLNFWCNIIQGIQLPFALLPLLHFTSSKRIMGNFKTSIYYQIASYLIAIFIIAINFYMLINLLVSLFCTILCIINVFILS